ncbi:hypothetical protein Taro_029253 [Colocasia esculenta]|uniref:RING-type domain-containing protein n=1 Tax=Colocasia esculenta TaxID=4460 RepID=A0A843VJE2_COLES|nr:hypothetical protein [Colocasia esculenta]
MASAPSDNVLNHLASGEEKGEGDDYDGDDVGEGDSNYHDAEEGRSPTEDNWSILSEADLQIRQKNNISSTIVVLSVSRAAACRLLVHHGWSISKQLRKRKVDAGREATCGICFNAPPRGAGMGDAVGYDVFYRCMSGFCWNCGDKAHRLVDCGTAAAWKAKNSSSSANAKYVLAYCKPCPKCKRPIENNSDCMNMRCPPPCNFDFCCGRGEQCAGDGLHPEQLAVEGGDHGDGDDTVVLLEVIKAAIMVGTPEVPTAARRARSLSPSVMLAD